MPKPRPLGFERADLGDAARLRFLGPHQPLPEVPDGRVEGGRARLDLATLVQSGGPGGSFLWDLGPPPTEPGLTGPPGRAAAGLPLPRPGDAIPQPHGLHPKLSPSPPAPIL